MNLRRSYLSLVAVGPSLIALGGYNGERCSESARKYPKYLGNIPKEPGNIRYILEISQKSPEISEISQKSPEISEIKEPHILCVGLFWGYFGYFRALLFRAPKEPHIDVKIALFTRVCRRFSDTVEVWDTRMGAWRVTCPLPSARAYMGAVAF